MAQRCGDTLSNYGQLLWDGNLIGDEAAAEAGGREIAAKKPDCVVVVTTIAVFGGICWAALKEIEAPILIWNPQLLETVGTGYTMEDIVRNTSQIGTQALANTLLRRAAPIGLSQDIKRAKGRSVTCSDSLPWSERLKFFAGPGSWQWEKSSP